MKPRRILQRIWIGICMETSDRIFADSNFFIALFHAGDSLYSHAQHIAKTIDVHRIPLVISNFIFLETVTVLAQRRGTSVARQAGLYLLSSPNIELIHIDVSLQHETWELFQAAGNKNISFVDFSTIAVMRAESIQKILTFDQADFKKLQKKFRFLFYTTKTL